MSAKTIFIMVLALYVGYLTVMLQHMTRFAEEAVANACVDMERQ